MRIMGMGQEGNGTAYDIHRSERFQLSLDP